MNTIQDPLTPARSADCLNPAALKSPFPYISLEPYPIVFARIDGACQVAETTSQNWAYCARAADVRRVLQELADAQQQLKALQDSLRGP